MPKSKLESLKEEQERLKQKKNPSTMDQRRQTELARLIRAEQAKFSGTLANVWRGSVGGAQRKASEATRMADVTEVRKRATKKALRSQLGFDPFADEDMTAMTPTVGPDGETPTGEYDFYGPAPGRENFRLGPKSYGGGQRSGSTIRKGRDMSMMTGMSIMEMQDFYYSLNDVELTKWQKDLMEAGLFKEDDPPILGQRDSATADAVNRLVRMSMDSPDTPLPEIIKKLKKANAGRMDGKVREMLGIGEEGEDGIPDQTTNISITDAETLGSLIDKLSVNLIGGLADPATKQALIQQIQDEERAFKLGAVRAEFDAGVTNEKNARKVQAKSKADASGATELDAFMDALIGQESGGNPNAVNADSGAMGIGQIMPENWGPWAAEAGVNPADFSEANQRKVIKYKLAQYYQSYGNWRDVAIAWYGGHGGVMRAKAGGGYADEDGYPSLHAYADSVLAKMGQSTAANLAGGRQSFPEPQLTVNVRSEMTDPETRIENELRRLHPGRYAGTKFAQQAEAFFNLLHGGTSRGY